MLKQQNARLKAQDAGVQTALEDSRQMLRDMEADGLLAKGTADTKPEQLGSFEGLAAEVKRLSLGRMPLWTAWCGQCAAPLCWAPRAQPPAT